MQVDLLLTPQACDTCIRGKQTHQLVPKQHEGRKAVRCLGCIFVDLAGLQSVIARSGCAYIMNIIHHLTSYHWT